MFPFFSNHDDCDVHFHFHSRRRTCTNNYLPIHYLLVLVFHSIQGTTYIIALAAAHSLSLSLSLSHTHTQTQTQTHTHHRFIASRLITHTHTHASTSPSGEKKGRRNMSTPPPTVQQLTTWAVLPKISGGISFLFSCVVIYQITRRRRHRRRGGVGSGRGGSQIQSSKSSLFQLSFYNRLMFGISCVGTVTGFATFLSTWPIPSQGSWEMFASGNDTTCKVQGFMIQMSIAMALYNASLSFYYLLAIKYSWNETKLGRYERIFHAVPVGWAITTAFICLGLDAYGSAVLWCWIGPSSSTNTDMYRMVFYYGPIWTSIVVVCVNLVAVFRHVRQITITAEMHMRRSITIGTAASAISAESGLSMTPPWNMSPSSSPDGPPGVGSPPSSCDRHSSPWSPPCIPSEEECGCVGSDGKHENDDVEIAVVKSSVRPPNIDDCNNIKNDGHNDDDDDELYRNQGFSSHIDDGDSNDDKNDTAAKSRSLKFNDSERTTLESIIQESECAAVEEAVGGVEDGTQHQTRQISSAVVADSNDEVDEDGKGNGIGTNKIEDNIADGRDSSSMEQNEVNHMTTHTSTDRKKGQQQRSCHQQRQQEQEQEQELMNLQRQQQQQQQQRRILQQRSSALSFARRRQQVAYQSLRFAVTFILTWAPLTTVRIMQMVDRQVPYWLLGWSAFQTPLFLPVFIVYSYPYIRDRYLRSYHSRR